MCEENDVKLREHFGQHLVSVKEDKFDVYFVDDSCDSGDASKFDSNSNADYPFEDDPVADEKVIIEDDSKMCPNEILMDTSVNNVDENDRPRYNFHRIFRLFWFNRNVFIEKCLRIKHGI